MMIRVEFLFVQNVSVFFFCQLLIDLNKRAKMLAKGKQNLVSHSRCPPKLRTHKKANRTI